MERWVVYFRERFPPAQYAAGLGAFTWAVLAYTDALGGARGLPRALPFLAAFAATFLLFLQLRILDEYKDYEDDLRDRPYRPVPRGLVTLPELGRLWLAAAAVQVVLSLALGPVPAVLLVAVLLYSGLMRVEFFAPAWLRAHPLAYMGSHMVIVPLIALFVAACAGPPPPLRAMAPLLALAYLNFSVFELGRKIRAPDEEETGVETYSALWGRRRAALAWLAALWSAGVVGLAAAWRVGIAPIYAASALALAFAATAAAAWFLAAARPKGAVFRAASAAWLLVIHLVFGLALAF
jgi:4-hydroxybenzoate polyprenyltransferase